MPQQAGSCRLSQTLGLIGTESMNDWTLRVGLACIAVGLVLLSPLADFLPVDFWQRARSLFSSSQSSEHFYYRVVPGQPSRTIEFVLIGVGLLLVFVSVFLRFRK